MLIIQNLSKQYPSQQVFKDISMKLTDGKIYGIVGENGAGKSTFFRCVAGMEKFEGNIKHEKYHLLKNHVGFLPTDPYYPPRITAEEYLYFCCYARHILKPNLQDTNLFELPLKKYAQQYSTGMKKKLALWAMLLQKNDYFILDEPFNGVDLTSNIQIREILLWLQLQGKTIFISSHILNTLTDVCDTIFYLNNGKIEQQFSKENYPSLQALFDKTYTHTKSMLLKMYDQS